MGKIKTGVQETEGVKRIFIFIFGIYSAQSKQMRNGGGWVLW